jgi:hypothetical protein
MTHERLEQYSLELHRTVADMLRHDPSLLERAKDNIKRWTVGRDLDKKNPYLEWLDLLDGSPEQIFELLESQSEKAVRLRQSTPFTGILPDNKRLEIFNRYAAVRA